MKTEDWKPQTENEAIKFMELIDFYATKHWVDNTQMEHWTISKKQWQELRKRLNEDEG